MNALLQNPYTEQWTAIGARLPRGPGWQVCSKHEKSNRDVRWSLEGNEREQGIFWLNGDMRTVPPAHARRERDS